ncbi:MAG: hypothetical protein DM484_16260 [Candidatus Methylumidiphilus alinenensis]|uniref:PDZ domain-containing protein n=1 Tax=Candidatus Methylumidiphilus alinenensis TaxID=2202197 RepID=A0A2W4SVB9_9GAMM|nr:MAG: hypothetical protein DM484_16260 [Candidatus Methylumidiphilus alinenensis]
MPILALVPQIVLKTSAALKLNVVDMPGPTEMGPLVADLKPGSQARLTVWRNGQSKLITMRVYEANDDTQQASAAAELSESRLGLAVYSLPQDGDGQTDGTGGLMVEQSSGPAARVGIAPAMSCWLSMIIHWRMPGCCAN